MKNMAFCKVGDNIYLQLQTESNMRRGPFWLLSYRELPPREGTRQTRLSEFSRHRLGNDLKKALEALDYVAKNLAEYEDRYGLRAKISRLRELVDDDGVFDALAAAFCNLLKNPKFVALVDQDDWETVEPYLQKILDEAHAVGS